MALVPAVLSLNWISNYSGPHRVCYRIVGAPTYICTVPGTPGPGFHPVCAGGGAPCSYDISILVDNETCDQVDYEIYVQPACEEEASIVGRIPLALSFIPDPACNRYEVTCNESAVSIVQIDIAGSGYTPGVYPGLPSVGGGGLGATFDITIGGGGDVTVATVATPGSGYTSAPTVDLTSIPFAPGVPANLIVNLLGCSPLTVYDCGGITGTVLPAGTFAVAETYDMCGSSIPTVPSDYSIIENGNCLCNCIITDVENTNAGGTIDYTYIACDGAVVTGSLPGSTALGNTCMVDGSLSTVVNLPAVELITIGAPCDAV